jgi:hypothetical protein
VSKRPIPLTFRVSLVFFFVVIGISHLWIHDFYFPCLPIWNTDYVVGPIRATGPISLLGAFLLALPRRSTEVCAVGVLSAFAALSISAHLYAAIFGLLFNDSPWSSFLNWTYVIFLVPVSIALFCLVVVPGSSPRSKKEAFSIALGLFFAVAQELPLQTAEGKIARGPSTAPTQGRLAQDDRIFFSRTARDCRPLPQDDGMGRTRARRR